MKQKKSLFVTMFALSTLSLIALISMIFQG